MRGLALPWMFLTTAASLLLHARPPSGTSSLLRLRAARPTCREEGDEISFGDLQVRGVIASRLLEEDFKVATPIQAAAMMPIHRGENAVLHAETGSGKTLAYLLPLLNRLHNSRPARSRRRLGGATACYPGLLGLTRQALGCATHSGRAAEPLRRQWSLRCGPEARLTVPMSRLLTTQAGPPLTLTRTRSQVGPTSCWSWCLRASWRCRSARWSSSCGHGTARGASACSAAPSLQRHSTRSYRPP